jgi:hypothetical protein
MNLATVPVDLFSSETLNVVGPIGTVLAMIAFIYWGLAKGKIVVGSQHLRELGHVEQQLTRERLEHDETIKQMREDHAAQIDKVRADADRAAERREAENVATIAGLRVDVARMYGAWQIEAESRERVTRAKDGAVGEGILSLLEAMRAGPMGSNLPPLEIEPTPTVGSDGG